MAVNTIGERLSFGSQLCTVRYVGPLKGKDGQWLGVEWDEPSRGKNDGILGGHRYFTCRSSEAGSFLRPDRADRDAPQTFVQAICHKYSSDQISTSPNKAVNSNATGFGSKIAEEVGFDRIREEQADISQIRVAILDGQGIAGTSRLSASDRRAQHEAISIACRSITELDLSRNLLATWDDVLDVVVALRGTVKRLRASGMRFDLDQRNVPIIPAAGIDAAVGRITHLSLDDTWLSWDELLHILKPFKALESLSFSGNRLACIPRIGQRLPLALRNLKLETNLFNSISDLVALVEAAPDLESLSLQFNTISQVARPGLPAGLRFASSLKSLNLSYNSFSSWEELAAIQSAFPGVQHLRISHNPISSSDSTAEDLLDESSRYLLTVAHVPNLVTLNYGTISVSDRLNADLYYISCCREALVRLKSDPSLEGREYTAAEQETLARFPRWKELCTKYGEESEVHVNPVKRESWMESRLIEFHFFLVGGDHGEVQAEKRIKIPRSTDIYRLKGWVWKFFGIRSHEIRLVWETDIWDPIEAGVVDEEDEEEDEDEPEGIEDGRQVTDVAGAPAELKQYDPKKWKTREVELEDSPREVGFWIDGRVARIRVERREFKMG